MHISCPINSFIVRSSVERNKGQYIGPTARPWLVSSYLIGLIHLTIICNNSGLNASPSLAPPGLNNAVGSYRQERWNGSARAGDASGGKNYYQPTLVPAVSGSSSSSGGNRLQPYQFQLKQPQEANLIPGRAQQPQQPLPPIRQPLSTLPPPLPPPPTTTTRHLQAAPLQHETLLGLIVNGTTTVRVAPPPPVGLVPNRQIINHTHYQQTQHVLRQSISYEQRQKQQVFAATNKQVVQPAHRQQDSHVAYATSSTTSFPVPVTATTTTTTTTATPHTVYRNSDITASGAALFSCLGCVDPRGWPLYKSLVSLQNPLLLGGDILVRTSAKRRPIATGIGRLYKSSRSALVDPVSLWPNGIIFYELDESVAHLAGLIWRVMQQFHVHTCIRFVPRQSNEPDFLHIAARRGCSSYIGRIGGEQILSLGDGCEFRGTIAHELLHAVGFYHHQNRSDRDDFLEILWENVAKGKEDQFRKMSAEENFLLNEFDYNSIMLYGPHTFGKTLDKITMKPKRKGVILLELIEKRGLSALDIDSVNKLYKCDGSGLGYDLAPEQPAAASSR